MIGQTISHYRIIEPLGEGGMGTVYLAEDTHLGRRVAIKFLSSLDPHYRARFLREARAVSALSHPNIAAVYDYGETTDGQPYIVMELVKGKALSDMLEEERLSLPRSVEIVSEIAEALGEAHRLGIIHRDVKPANVVINERGQVKVLDFGLVKQLDELDSAKADPATRFAYTQSDVIVGTPLYLSPEQATGKKVDGRSDLFALGALLYECITGQSAFSGTSVIEIGAQVIHVTPAPPSQTNPRIPAELDRVTMKALQKNPDARHQSAAELIAELNAVSATLPSDGDYPPRAPASVARASALTTLTQTLRRPRLSLGAFLIGAIIVAFIVWAAMRYWKPAPYQPTSEALAWYNKGVDALRNGAFLQASKALEQAVAADPDFALAHARLAEAYTELDYTDKAKDELLRVSSLVPDRSQLPRVDALYLTGINSTVTRDFSDAVKAFDELAKLTPEDGHAFVDLGRAYEKTDNIEKALENYLKATTLDGQYATAYLRAGDIHSRKQEVASASAAFEKAQALFKALGNAEGIGEVQRLRGILFRGVGKIAESRAQFQEGLETAKATGNEAQQVLCLIELAHLAFNEGSNKEAQGYAMQAVEFAQQRHLENLTAGGLIELGNSFSSSGDYPQAEKYFKEAIALSRAQNGRRREAIGKMNLGAVYIHQLRTDEGLALNQEALSYFRQGNYPRQILICLNYIGRSQRQKGDYEAALKTFAEKLERAKQGGDQSEIAFAYGEVGSVHAELEQYAEALRKYSDSYEINKSLDNKLQLAYNLHNRGNMLWNLGRYSDARASLDEALKIASQPGTDYKPLLAEIELSFAQIYLSERQFAEARTRATTALKLARDKYKQVEIAARTTLGLAKALDGSAREGMADCEASLEKARTANDYALLTRTLIAAAVAALESNNAEKSLQLGNEARDRAARGGNKESQWLACTMAARAHEKLGDLGEAQNQKAQAERVITELRGSFGEFADSYSARRDIEYYRKQSG
ncbi:MAG: tetratricopeptide repeat protein [Pyrinomonadaceae bacterium]